MQPYYVNSSWVFANLGKRFISMMKYEKWWILSKKKWQQMEPQKRKRYIVMEIAPILCVVCTGVHGDANDGDTKTRVNDVRLGKS